MSLANNETYMLPLIRTVCKKCSKHCKKNKYILRIKCVP